MLQWINDRVKFFGWFIVLPVALTFAVWGVHGIVDFSTRVEKGVRVNGHEVDGERLRQAWMEELAQLSRQYPDGVPADVRASTQQRILDQFVNSALIDERTQQQRFMVTDKDVVDSIRAFKAFQVNGEFSKDAYYVLLRERGYTPERFEAEQRQLLRARALEGVVMLSSFVLPGEVARAVALREETREVGYAVLPLAKFLPAAKVDEAAITAWYEAHKDSYRTPETVKLRYVALKVADVAREVAVDDAALRAYYDTVKERFTEAEKRRARHILIPSGSDDAAARKKADEAYAEAVKPGADFAALARKYSQDAGSAPQGGDLGWAEKSFFVAPFADALWGMKPGEVHAPVKTQFGWHVIRLEEVQPAKSRSFEEVRAELVPEYQKSEAERRFSESQEKLEQLAFEQSGSLEPIAKALGLRIEEVTGFRKDLPDNELAANPKVVAAAFSADVLGGQNSKAIELAPGDVVVLRATDHALPAQQPLEAVHAEVALAVRRAAAAADAKAAGERVAAALDAGASWEAALKPLGGAAAKGKTAPPADAIRLEAPKFVGRRDKELPPEIIAAAFAAPAPAAGKTLAANAVLASGDVAVYALTAVKPGVVKAGDDAARTELREASGTADFLTYLELLRAGADVHASPAIFE